MSHATLFTVIRVFTFIIPACWFFTCCSQWSQPPGSCTWLIARTRPYPINLKCAVKTQDSYLACRVSADHRGGCLKAGKDSWDITYISFNDQTAAPLPSEELISCLWLPLVVCVCRIRPTRVTSWKWGQQGFPYLSKTSRDEGNTHAWVSKCTGMTQSKTKKR